VGGNAEDEGGECGRGDARGKPQGTTPGGASR
jgi:hypothetical protein